MRYLLRVLTKTDSHTDSLTLLRFRDLKAANVARFWSTLYAWMALEVDPFPSPIRLGKRSLAWRRSDVEAWLERRDEAK